MAIGIILLAGQLALYAILIWSLSRWLAKSERFAKLAILWACLVLGLIGGVLTAWIWPGLDSIFYPNVPAFLLGEQLYIWATSTVAPGTPSPHNAILWPLRTPQVFVFAALILFGLLGAILQAAFYCVRNRAETRKSNDRK